MINVVTQAQDDQEDHKDYEFLVAHVVLLPDKPSWRPKNFQFVPAVTYRDDALSYMRQSDTGELYQRPLAFSIIMLLWSPSVPLLESASLS
jgi:hypothetical protein